MREERVFDGARLRAQALAPRGAGTKLGGLLLVTFDFRRDVRGGETFLPAKFSGRLKRKGISQLRILSARNDWYANAETPDLEQALAAYAARFNRVQMFGFSMGGFGAFRFAKTMGAAQVLAVSPTFGIWADVHMFGRRRAEDLPDDLPDPQFFMPQPDSTLRGVIALDSMRDRDMVHMRKMHSLFPAVDLARLPFSGHPQAK